METVVGVGVSDEGKIKDSEFANLICNTSPTKQFEDPIVYKLVRVEGDGRLVPATDDEIIEVADLLKDESIDMDIIANTEDMHISIEESANAQTLPESSGLPQSEENKGAPENANVVFQDNALPLVDKSDGRGINRYSDAGECCNPPDANIESELSPNAVCGSLNPDFSKLKGEICLDNLSIRELHETFRATFGRETTVKDKGWLKRRIIMGLTNSCDLSVSSFIIKDNQVLTMGNGVHSENVCDQAEFSYPLGAMNEDNEFSVVKKSNHKAESQVVSLKRLRSHEISDSYRSDSSNPEETTAKRIRKPTRRYIEELSDVESRERSGRPGSLCGGSGHTSPRLYSMSGKSVLSDSRTYVTRLDSLAGIQVPCVSRLRRSRPRKDVMSLMLVKEPDKPRQSNNKDKTEQNEDLNGRDSGSLEDISHDNVVTVPTAKGGMRRKHHRAWTLSEVMKLVDGVSRYGAGRWSEIKRLAFASYSYRTSVDLKDKWRNLLKAANFASTPTDLMNSRKHAATPIPAPILSRVRELAEINGQALPSNVSSSTSGVSGRSEKGSAQVYL